MRQTHRSWLVVFFSFVTFGCGSDSTPGPSGEAGVSTAVRVSPASADECPDGGDIVEFGLDQNSDGELSDSEVTSSSTLCGGDTGAAGAPGEDGLDSLISTADEPAGANCAAGGTRIDVGSDDDGDGLLGAAEIDATEFVCDGTDGLTSLTLVTDEAAGSNCPDGGQRIDVGIDLDADGELASAEISSTAYLCNGSDGVSTLVLSTPEPAGSNCAAGGQRIDVGQDDSGDSVLDSAEIDQTTFICDGESGSDGLNSLVRVTDEPDGANCENGGVRIDVGLDDDASQILEATEIDATTYICAPSSVLVALIAAPDPSTVFDTPESCYLFTNNLITSFWDPVSNLIFTGDFIDPGYWAFAPESTGWTGAPDVQTGDSWGRMHLIPASRVVVGGMGTSAQFALPAADHWIALMDDSGQISGRQAAIFSDGFAGSCGQSSISSTEYLCYDGANVRHYSTSALSPVLQFEKSVPLASLPPSSEGFGASFAWDGLYYYFMTGSFGSSSASLTYRAYRSNGSVEGDYTAAGSGAINATYFDWNIGRYSTHDGYGGRPSASVYAGASGGSDSHCFGPPSPYHSNTN